MSVARPLLFALAMAACGSSSAPPPPPPPPPVVADAGVADAEALQPGEGTARPATKRPSRPIEIVLRSSPVPARVSVDGALLGNTPQVWLGDSGGEHEFAFQAPGYALARFRFTPITSGVIHPRLDPDVEAGDAGVGPPPPPEVMPPQRPAPATVDVDAQPAPIAPVDVPAPVMPVDAAPAPIGPQP